MISLGFYQLFCLLLRFLTLPNPASNYLRFSFHVSHFQVDVLLSFKDLSQLRIHIFGRRKLRPHSVQPLLHKHLDLCVKLWTKLSLHFARESRANKFFEIAPMAINALCASDLGQERLEDTWKREGRSIKSVWKVTWRRQERSIKSILEVNFQHSNITLISHPTPPHPTPPHPTKQAVTTMGQVRVKRT